MKTLLSIFTIVGAVISATAIPRVDLTDVTLSQGAIVKVSYTLKNEPGIVTVDFQTNSTAGGWVSIGVENFTNVLGAVNRYVGTIDKTQTILWRYSETWPGNLVTNGFRAVVTAWPTNNPPDYAALAIDGSKNHRFYTCAEALPGGVSDIKYKRDVLLMRRVHADNKRFSMGAAYNERGFGSSNGAKRHFVSFTNDWYMGVYELTQSQAFTIFGNSTRWALEAHRNHPDRDILPASYIHYGHIKKETANAATGYVASVSIPTEAQWEYTCRAGCPMALYNYRELGDNGYSREPSVVSTNLNEIAWYGENISDNTTPKPVGLLKPNDWGFYDMLGNMPEYCRDYYVDDPSIIFDWTKEQVDPQGPTAAQTTDNGKYRTKRGGGIRTTSTYNTSAARDEIHGNYQNEYIGLRLQCNASFNFSDTAR
ncbi:MAG: formylglycine-generating enzyme family protein [Kiritimatiellae bacterium]|nr:formylglycine-generating enzyme family protein [Kiritimatiellia bacterium]